jgi:NarL family two-component system response regulator YdfI
VIRVLVVASSPAVRAGLLALLSGQTGFTVLESAVAPSTLSDTAEIIEADVVLLALEPGESPVYSLPAGPDRVARLPAMVVLGDAPAQSWSGRALRSGALGALPRTATADQIVAAVMAAAAGLAVREPASVRSAVSAVTPFEPVQSLTPREVEILGLMAEGLGNKGIGARLGISEHTVKTHVGSLFAKLRVSTRAEAVASAARFGLIML